MKGNYGRISFLEIFDDITKEGRKISKEEYLSDGLYPIIDQGKNIVGGYSNEVEGIFENIPAIIFGDHTRVLKYVEEPCFLGADGVKLLKPKEAFDENPKYLYYALKSIRIPDTGYNRHFKWLKESTIYLHSKKEQDSIVSILDTIEELAILRAKELQKCDELIKARFVELFGDPTIIDKDKAYMPMTSICEIIDGDRGKNYPKQEEFYEDGYCLFLNAKNVTSNGFDFTNCMFITKEKDELLRKGKLNRGDVVLTTRGTIGNLAYYSDDVPFDNVRINSGMVILRMNHELVDEIFFIEQFKLQLAEIKEKIASGSAQPQLPISTMNKIQMLVPEITKQIDFTNFVKQTDKSKLAVQKSLEQLETLKKSLMQQFFS